MQCISLSDQTLSRIRGCGYARLVLLLVYTPIKRKPFNHYLRYEASAQDVENGVLRMHRTISSDDVEGYASHLPKDEVKLQKDEDIVYSKGVLTSASGTTFCKLMPKVLSYAQACS